MRKCYNTCCVVFLVYSIGMVATVPNFFLLNIYVSWYIYCYSNTKNFTIFSQLLTCQFLTSRNKNKIWDCDQPQLKINILRKCYKTYCAVLLVYSIGTVATMPKVFFFFFLIVIGLCFFFSFKYLCKLVYILLYWHKKFHN